MPSYKLYKILHLTGIVVVCMTVAGLAFHAWLDGTREAAGEARKRLLAAPGVAMVVSLVGGMGAAATAGFISSENGFASWIWLKMTLWVIFGALPMIPYRAPEKAARLFIVVPVLLALAAWVAGGFQPLIR